ncbi:MULTISPECIES: hydroxymethylglutaryl-CoA reductase, degradative [unclassified Halomonas]|uniref:hydroxymethylglutaryl-CoA reductase, degradative n=1 Tax=unclassified Halomonas TaxID=2609666 RepID=UPI001CF5A6BE|nr:MULTISPECIES: hydroxymethylglutaryl-CoA reductase, degradative [unclassified Halomonas]MCA8862929.1 hydroxymethylglutaryl-CoA reductase, degradative [Halomonas sp. SBBP1]UZH09566.1 hydroxymethylglutaryl-CoA reductase, degradative [Halomonas sp. BDJS001]
MTIKSSRIPGFYQLSPRERLRKVAALSGLDATGEAHLADTGNLPAETADSMIENVIGTLNIPIGVATNLMIDGEEPLVPMATEESSVVAAVCNAARQCRASGGFYTDTSSPIMIAQVQLLGVSNPDFARLRLLEAREEIKRICDATDPVLLEHGGGFQDIEVRVLEDMVIVHLLVDVRDAMGANAVNSMAEAVAPSLAEWSGGESRLRILSNLADRRLARVRATWHLDQIGGESVRDGILAAYRFADLDPYRAATHNKGVMNGVSAVVLATGNDTRAVEAGAHAYAARTGRYRSLTHWEADRDGSLTGTLEMPMPVGLIGGATRAHPTARRCLEILGVNSADRLARIIVAVGLAQNFAALKALATTGIQKGHMALHAKNIALMAGAVGAEVALVADELVKQGSVRVDIAQAALAKLRSKPE